MPLVRFEVRNEYKLGGSQLYKDGVLAEDPKPLLDGLAVAGLVGILRQLGDLAEFAAEVFHGLQEQVASTSSRSRKLVTRVQRIEASLPQLEKVILSQTSHIHYAYTPGCSLHAHIGNTQNHFIYDDLPSFIMDSYEGCREPPCLQLLDRFDTGGPGSCLKRYSDPTFFRRASASSDVCNSEKSLHERKVRKMKRRTRKHRENYRKISPFSNDSERMQPPTPIAQEPTSVSHAESTVDTTFKSDVVDSSDLGSKDVINFIECELHPNTSVEPDDAKSTELSSVQNENTMATHDSIYVYGQNYGTDDLEYLIETKSDHKSLPKSNIESYNLKTTVNDIRDVETANVNLVKPKLRLVDGSANAVEDLSERESGSDSQIDENRPRTIIGTRPDYAVDEAQDMVEKYELHDHDLGLATKKFVAQVEDFPGGENTSKLISDDCLINDSLDRKWETIDEVHYAEPSQVYGPDCGIDDVQYMLENFELHEHGLGPATTECVAQVEGLSRGESSSRLISGESPGNDSLERKWETIDDGRFAEPNQLYGSNFGIDDARYMLENFEPRELDLGAATMKLVKSQIDDVENNFDTIEGKSETINMEPVSQMGVFPERENGVTVIEWNRLDDMDSETDQYVDALNTIESESSDFEGQTKKELISYSSCKNELVEYAEFVQKEELINQQKEHEFLCSSNDDKENDTLNSNALLTSINEESLGHAESSCSVSVAAMINLFDPKHESVSVSFDHKQEVLDPSHNCSIEHAQSSCNIVDAEISQITSPREPQQDCDSEFLDNEEQVPDASLDSKATDTYPLAFWTNGTLFGLQPSKPDVLNSPNTVNSNPVSKTNIPNNMQKVENCAAWASSVKDPGFGNGLIESKVDMGDQDAGYFNHCSHQTSDRKYEKSIGHDPSNLAEQSMIRGLSNGSITHHEVKAPSRANLKNVSTEVINTRREKLSLMTVLGCELLRNGLRAGSFDYADKSNTTILMPNELENKSKGKLNSPVSSPPLSPPLDHMKISFGPINGFGASRLKLKYPEGFDQHESIIDNFPSFQLVPEPSNLKVDAGSDSDDDTFCRSYACMSDDNLAHLSDSNSDDWESGGASESNNPAFYDGLCRISSTEFASSSTQCEETDHGSINVCSISGHVVHSGSAPSFHLPFLGSQIPFSYIGSTMCLHTEEVKTSHVQKPTPKTSELDEQQLDSRSLHNKMKNVGRAEENDGFLHQIRTKSFNLRHTETARSSYLPNNTASTKVTAILQKANAIRQAVASNGDDDSWSDT